MTKGAFTKVDRDLGQFLANTNSIPESLQFGLAGLALVSFLILWASGVAAVIVLLPCAIVGSLVLYFLAFRIPALRTSLRVYENGLESVVHGKTAAFAYDELTAISARFTDHIVNHQYIGTRVKIEFFVDGRLSPCVHECEFRHGLHGERVVSLAIERSSQAIERKLLAQLERDGSLPWRDNVSLTPDGLLLTDKGGTASRSDDTVRLIPYDQICRLKVADNELKIWKNNDGLPFFVMKNDTPNFTPLLGLFQSLCQTIQNIEPAPTRAAEVPVA